MLINSLFLNLFPQLLYYNQIIKISRLLLNFLFLNKTESSLLFQLIAGSD